MTPVPLKPYGFWHRFRQNRAAVAGFGIGVLMIGAALLAPLLTPFDPFDLSGEPFLAPAAPHLMGTDNMGRDVLSGVLHGARTSIGIGVFAALTSAAVGTFLGGLAGYFGGRIDALLMRVTDIFMTIPPFFLAVLVVAFVGAEVHNLVLVIGLLAWPPIARLLRAEFLKWKQMEFVDAARQFGASDFRIAVREILPNAVGPVVALATLQVGFAILAEASLSFVGLGDPNIASWGYMLRNAQDYLRSGWWIATFPGFAVLLTVLALNLVGDGIAEAINPRQSRHPRAA